MSTTTPSLQNRLAAAQPWLQDQYATVRANVGPRIEQTRAVVVPAIEAASDKVRTEVLPKTADLVSRAAAQAADRSTELMSRAAAQAAEKSAPLLAELSARAQDATTALRDKVADQQAAVLHSRAKSRTRRRRVVLIAAAAMAGAAAATAVVVWRRGRDQAWVEDEPVSETLTEPAPTDGTGYEPGVESDPSNADAAAEPNENQNHSSAQHARK